MSLCREDKNALIELIELCFRAAFTGDFQVNSLTSDYQVVVQQHRAAVYVDEDDEPVLELEAED